MRSPSRELVPAECETCGSQPHFGRKVSTPHLRHSPPADHYQTNPTSLEPLRRDLPRGRTELPGRARTWSCWQRGRAENDASLERCCVEQPLLTGSGLLLPTDLTHISGGLFESDSGDLRQRIGNASSNFMCVFKGGKMRM